MRRVYAPRALRDIDELLAYIQKRSPNGAHAVSVAIEHAVDLLERHPDVGSFTDEPSIFRYPLARYRYTLFYRVDRSREIVEIVRVVHGSRVRDLRQMPGN